MCEVWASCSLGCLAISSGAVDGGFSLCESFEFLKLLLSKFFTPHWHVVLSVFYPKFTLSIAQGFLVLLSLCYTGLWLSNSPNHVTWRLQVICAAVLHWGHATLCLFQVGPRLFNLTRIFLRETDRSQTESKPDVMSEATLPWEVKMWTQSIKALQKYERIKGCDRCYQVFRSCIWWFESLINLKRLEYMLVQKLLYHLLSGGSPRTLKPIDSFQAWTTYLTWRHVGHVMILWDSKMAKEQIMMRYDWIS